LKKVKNYRKKSERGFEMFKKEFLEGVITGIAIGIVISRIVKVGIKKIKDRTRPMPPRIPPIPSYPFLYLSQFNNLLKKFNLSPDNIDNFSKLREKLQSEGRNKAKNCLMKIIHDKEDLKEKARKIIEGCKELEKEKYEIIIEPPKSDDSPKIYPSIIKMYIQELKLKADTQKDFEEAMKNVLNHIYHLGITEVLDRIKVELSYLEKGVEEGDIEAIKREIENIKNEIEKI
jgi:hypothetical protein